jgi:hypothetical protein
MKTYVKKINLGLEYQSKCAPHSRKKKETLTYILHIFPGSSFLVQVPVRNVF